MILIFGGLLTLGIFVFNRYQSNPQQIVPYPFTFVNPPEKFTPEAPILIVGDRMGQYFGKFSSYLSEAISTNLSKPIKIQTIAEKETPLHRTLHELKGLTQWPQIVIYQGGSEEFIEQTFDLTEIPKIKENFARFKDDRVETALILRPELSRIIYEPIKQIKLGDSPKLIEDMSQEKYLKLLETQLMLYQEELTELAKLSQDRGFLLILTTTPINLDEAPRSICEFTRSTEIDAQLLELKDLIKARNFKTAYSKSSKLITAYSGNPELFYLHGQILRGMGKKDQAIENLLLASSYDCLPWRATELQNSIIRKIANDHQILLFDFSKMVNSSYTENTLFFDEIYPQNIFYEKGMRQLGLVIKGILRL